MTIDKLREYGADVEDGLARCMNNEEFYLRMINLGLSDERFEALGVALRESDKDKAFEMAHALKGVVGNLALTPIYQPISELTELLRHKEEGDYHGLYSKMMEERERLLSM